MNMLKIGSKQFELASTPNPLQVLERYYQGDPQVKNCVNLRDLSLDKRGGTVSILDAPQDCIVEDYNGRQIIDVDALGDLAQKSKKAVMVVMLDMRLLENRDYSRYTVAYPDETGPRVLFLERIGVFDRLRPQITEQVQNTNPYSDVSIKTIEQFYTDDLREVEKAYDTPGMFGALARVAGMSENSVSLTFDGRPILKNQNMLTLTTNTQMVNRLNAFNIQLGFSGVLSPSDTSILDFEKYYNNAQARVAQIACRGMTSYLHDITAHAIGMTVSGSVEFAGVMADRASDKTIDTAYSGLLQHGLQHNISDLVRNVSVAVRNRKATSLSDWEKQNLGRKLSSELHGFDQSTQEVRTFVDKIISNYDMIEDKARTTYDSSNDVQ